MCIAFFSLLPFSCWHIPRIKRDIGIYWPKGCWKGKKNRWKRTGYFPSVLLMINEFLYDKRFFVESVLSVVVSGPILFTWEINLLLRMNFARYTLYREAFFLPFFFYSFRDRWWSDIIPRVLKFKKELKKSVAFCADSLFIKKIFLNRIKETNVVFIVKFQICSPRDTI